MVTPRVKNMGNLNKLIKENMNSVSIALFFVFGLSGSIYCYINTGAINDGYIVNIACAIAFFGFGIFSQYLIKYFKGMKDVVIFMIAFVIAILTIYRATRENEAFRLSQLLLEVPAITLIMYIVLREIVNLLIKSFKDKETFIFWIVASIIVSLTVIILFSNNDFFYKQIDRYLSLDSGLCFEYYKTTTALYGEIIDIKHPILWILYYPLYSLSYYFAKITSIPIDLSSALFYQLANVQFIIISGLILTNIANNRYLKYIFIVSAPALTLLLFLEKFQIVLFSISMMLYYLNNNQFNKSAWAGAVSAALMPTSSVIVLGLLVFKNIKVVTKLKTIFSAAIRTFVIIISLGFTFGILHFNTLMEEHIKMSAGRNSTIFNLLCSYTHLFKNMLIQGNIVQKEAFLDYHKIQGGIVMWWDDSLLTFASILGLLLIMLAIYCIIKYRNSDQVRHCGFWMVFSFVLIVVFRWSWFESPLFSWYFSWALLLICNPLIESIANKFKQRVYFYVPLLLTIAIINLMIDFSAILKIMTY